MNLDDAPFVDCELLWTPSLDLSIAEPMLLEALTTAWDNGQSIDGAIKQILSSEDMTRLFEEQIKKSVDFQREQELKIIELEREKRELQAEQERKQKEKELKLRFEEEKAKRKADLEEKKKESLRIEQRRRLAKKRVDDMREKIRLKQKELGGNAKLRALKDVKKEYAARAPNPQTRSDYKTKKETVTKEISKIDSKSPDGLEVVIDENKGGQTYAVSSDFVDSYDSGRVAAGSEIVPYVPYKERRFLGRLKYVFAEYDLIDLFRRKKNRKSPEARYKKNLGDT